MAGVSFGPENAEKGRGPERTFCEVVKGKLTPELLAPSRYWRSQNDGMTSRKGYIQGLEAA